jgi:uncharacterized protein (DUF1501 family)
MHRREFLLGLGAGTLCAVTPNLAFAAGDIRRLLILVELKGGNDGLNTVIPYSDPLYTSLRPKIAIKRDEVIPLNQSTALHPSLQALIPLWKSGELAVLQSVGYPQPNLSHFRSIEIWDTASAASEFLHDGWLARVFARQAVPNNYLADGVLIGSNDLGPLTGTRAIALQNPAQFTRQARLAGTAAAEGSPALRHILNVENDVAQAGKRLDTSYVFKTEFPKGAFGDAVKTGCAVLAGGQVAVLRLTLGGFDTHQNQPGTHANLLHQLADGLSALRAALGELNRWQDTLIMTYSEFGRRARENQSSGTDHGTAAPHFVLGGRVKGGIFGAPPALDRLDGNGNLPFETDFRSLYATVGERWWGFPAGSLFGNRIRPLEFLRS